MDSRAQKSNATDDSNAKTESHNITDVIVWLAGVEVMHDERCFVLFTYVRHSHSVRSTRRPSHII